MFSYYYLIGSFRALAGEGVLELALIIFAMLTMIHILAIGVLGLYELLKTSAVAGDPKIIFILVSVMVITFISLRKHQKKTLIA